MIIGIVSAIGGAQGAKKSSMIYTKHVVAEMQGLVQRCVICGEVIADYTHAMFPEGSSVPQGWADGEVYVSDTTSPKIFTTMVSDEDNVVNCS